MHRLNVRLFAAAALAAIALAACSSSSKTSTPATTPVTTAAPSATTTPVTAGAPTAATVSIANSKYGKILVDSKGMTVYVDENDKPGKPACTGSCLTAWPPVASTTPLTVGAGLDAAKYTTVTASDGTKQLAVNGSPLYTWVNDKKPGDVTGQDTNGFYVVMTNGIKYDPGATKTTGS